MINRMGRPSAPETSGGERVGSTFTGHRGLDHFEPLIHEIGDPAKSGTDWPETAESGDNYLAGMERGEPIGLPGLTEPEAMRHYVRLSRMNFAIDMGIYPLGSCTMKHNPRLNEKLARLPGLSDLHPLQPFETVQGALSLMVELSDWLMRLTGMPAIALSPKAGAHGELCGLMAIRRALESQGDPRRVVLVPESAHGTNPATAAMCGYGVRSIPGGATGRVALEACKAQLGPDVAALMLTNPNTCGLFETDILEIAAAVHEAGAYFYCDGANFNAIVGKVRPGDLGVDAMHLNLHKTFSTPHGGGGPGSGPVVFSEALAPYIPVPRIERGPEGWRLVEQVADAPESLGRLTAFAGQMGMFIRALAYMFSHGGDGLRQVAEDAVLAANYVRVGLKDALTPAFEGLCMHEVLFDDSFLKGTGVTTLDFAKAMIDEGFHPMTMYFPLVVHGALLIEPTESESKQSLDLFIAALRDLAESAQAGNRERFTHAPRFAPVGRVDETRAARQPRLRWRPDNATAAAE